MAPRRSTRNPRRRTLRPRLPPTSAAGRATDGHSDRDRHYHAVADRTPPYPVAPRPTATPPRVATLSPTATPLSGRRGRGRRPHLRQLPHPHQPQPPRPLLRVPSRRRRVSWESPSPSRPSIESSSATARRSSPCMPRGRAARDWTGVGTCPSRTGRASRSKTAGSRDSELPSRGLSGPIPPALGSLSQLRALNLADNRLTRRHPVAAGEPPTLTGREPGR